MLFDGHHGLPAPDRPAERVDQGLPLRISAVAETPHFDRKILEFSDKVDVLLDGKVLPEASGWNVVDGEVLVKRRDRDGRAIVEGGVPTYVTLRGRVEVRWIRAGGEGHRHA